MSKQENCKPQPSSQPAASGNGGPGPLKTIRSIQGPSQKTTPVGPKDAPFYEK